MAKAPPIPRDQRTFINPKGKADVAGPRTDRRDERTDLESFQPGDQFEVNLAEQGRFGNMRQNLTPQRRVQDR
jgi:hypothetical protein